MPPFVFERGKGYMGHRRLGVKKTYSKQELHWLDIGMIGYVQWNVNGMDIDL